jgi:hypothetical protein
MCCTTSRRPKTQYDDSMAGVGQHGVENTWYNMQVLGGVQQAEQEIAGAVITAS